MEETLKTRSDISVVLLFFIFLSILGVVGAGFIVNDYARARASMGWPVYDGIVLSQRGSGDKLRYVYSVDGRSYEGSRRVFFSGQFATSKIQTPGPGETIRVYVDPGDHSFAVLYPGGASAFFVIGSLFTGLCVFFGFGGIVRTLTVAAQDEYVIEVEPTY